MKQMLFTVFFVATMTAMNAQQFELRIVEKGPKAHVQMRSVYDQAPTTQDRVTDIVFGVIWTNRAIKGVDVQAGAYGIRKSGTVQEHKGFYYQAFGAMGTPYNFPTEWKKDQWEDIAILDVDGGQNWGFYFRKQLGLAMPGFHVTTEPNVGFKLVDETPRIDNFDFNYQLKDFDAQPHESYSAIVNWNAEEHDLLDGYIVERSLNGKNWREVGYVERNVQNPSYEFVDTKLEGVRNGVYYRLRIEDKFGGYTYSQKDFVPFQVSVKIFPNPSVDGLNVVIDRKGVVKPDQLVIYDVQGRLIYKQEIAKDSFQEYINYSKTGLQGGAYILELRKDDEIFWNEKFEIMNRT